MRAVAAEAGVAPMGVYNHFDGKEGLLDAVVTDGFAEFGRAIAATDDDATARLLASGLGYRAFALANPVPLLADVLQQVPARRRDGGAGLEVLVDIIRYAQVGGLSPGDAEVGVAKCGRAYTAPSPSNCREQHRRAPMRRPSTRMCCGWSPQVSARSAQRPPTVPPVPARWTVLMNARWFLLLA